MLLATTSRLLRLLVFPLLNSLPLLLAAQSNYIATAPASATPGSSNVIVGISAGNSKMTGSENTIVGTTAGNANTTGSGNTFIGIAAGQRNTTGNVNTFVGGLVGVSNTEGHNNTFTGYASGASNISGSYNAFFGEATGNLTTTGNFNSFVGEGSGARNTSGSYNTFVGHRSGYSSQTGQFNTLLGDQSGYNAVADSNTFIGYRSGFNTTTGQGNIFLGTTAGEGNTTGSHNVIIGNKAGPTNSNTDENVYIGYRSGQRDNGSRNTLIGIESDVSGRYLYNATAIGAGAQVAVSNALVLGNNVNVGIGTSAPATRLEVVSSEDNTSGIRLSNLTTRSPILHSTNQFLTVNDQGDIIKARYQLHISNPGEWSDKVFSPTYPLRSLNEVAAYVQQQGHLPGVPSADEVVKEGVDLVKMNTLLLEKVEELTLYLIQQKKRIDQLEETVKQINKP